MKPVRLLRKFAAAAATGLLAMGVVAGVATASENIDPNPGNSGEVFSTDNSGEVFAAGGNSGEVFSVVNGNSGEVFSTDNSGEVFAVNGNSGEVF